AAAGNRLRQAQLAAGIDLDIARAGRHVAGQLHADAGFGAHQADRAGIHATQRRTVDGQLRLVRLVGCALADGQVGNFDIVGAGDDVELVGVQLGVDPGAAGDQVELVDVAGVEALAFDADGTALDLQAIQAAALDDRLAGGEGG